MADDQTVTATQLPSREYHHLFPDALLTKVGTLDPSKSMRALNCALITWSTNRTISSKPPLQYLEERTSKAELGEAEIQSRLASHVIPYNELAASGPYGEYDGDQVAKDYDQFLQLGQSLCSPSSRSFALAASRRQAFTRNAIAGQREIGSVSQYVGTA